MNSEHKTPRFVLKPGYVISKSDGDRHFISVHQLRWLYSIPRGSSVVTFQEGMTIRDGDVICEPRYDGNYPAFDVRTRR